MLSGAKQAVETRLLNFLSYNYNHLPMYAKPGMVWVWYVKLLTFLQKKNLSLKKFFQIDQKLFALS